MTKHFPLIAARSTLVIGALALAGAGCGAAANHHAGAAVANHPASGAAVSHRVSRPTTGKPQITGAVQRLTPATTEAQITALQQRVGLSVKSVRCPRHVEIVNRHTFTCVTTLAKGAPITTTVTPTNAAQGEAHFVFPLPD
jgi:hypothetical protein